MADPGFRRGGAVTTVGTGRVPVVPDVVVVRLAAEATDADPAAAHDAASLAAGSLVEALLGAGVRRTDVRTAATSSWTDPGETLTDGSGTVTRLPHTTVRLAVEARLRDVAGAGAVIGAALSAAGGAARLEGTTLQVSDPGPATGEARAAAFAQARAAAVHLAELAGRGLGQVLDVREGGAADGSGPERMMRMAVGAMPVEAGEQEVVVQLVVRFGWQDLRFEDPAVSG